MLGGEAETMSIWSLMRRIPSLRWVMIQAGLAALFAVWRRLLAGAALARTHRRGPIDPPNTPWHSGPCWPEPASGSP